MPFLSPNSIITTGAIIKIHQTIIEQLRSRPAVVSIRCSVYHCQQNLRFEDRVMDVKRNDRSLARRLWGRSIKLLFDHRANERGEHTPEECWVSIEDITYLEDDEANIIFPDRREAYILEAGLESTEQRCDSLVVAVPGLRPAEDAQYCAGWSEKCSLYCFREVSTGWPSENPSESIPQQHSPEVEDDDSATDPQDTVAADSEGCRETENLREDFWRDLYYTPAGEANPPGLPRDVEWRPPVGDYHALSFDCLPQGFKSTTPAAVSLWAILASSFYHYKHGMRRKSDRSRKRKGHPPFTRESILSSQACRTVTPVVYNGPGDLLFNSRGSDFQETVAGHARRSFLNFGKIDETFHGEEPHGFHDVHEAHFSSLTMSSCLTQPYYIDDNDPNHKLFSIYKPACMRDRWIFILGSALARGYRRSPLWQVESCYEDEDQNDLSIDPDMTDSITSSFSQSSIGSSSPEPQAMPRSSEAESDTPYDSDDSDFDSGGDVDNGMEEDEAC